MPGHIKNAFDLLADFLLRLCECLHGAGDPEPQVVLIPLLHDRVGVGLNPLIGPTDRPDDPGTGPALLCIK